MKKILGIGVVFAGVLLLTGCGDSNSYTCTVTYTEGDESMTQEIVTHYDKNDKVESYDIVLNYTTKEAAEQGYQIYSTIKGATVTKSGKKITIADAQKIEESQMSLVGFTKEEVKAYVLESEPDAVCK